MKPRQVFFYKMIGDNYRCVLNDECAYASKMDSVKQGALDNYELAQMTCQSFDPYNPIRLGLALNFSVFHYEVMLNHKLACDLGEQAL